MPPRRRRYSPNGPSSLISSRSVALRLYPIRRAEVGQPLQCYLRAVELEMRAAEEPLRSGLDVKGLRAQVLGRIEELEEREREKEELAAELVPAMEARGYDPPPIREAMG
jgi:hypothetical protein